jgi:crotonobetainyl-CoA:carnitine CoA-transferase CaiB-like acyl-CoA transferase
MGSEHPNIVPYGSIFRDSKQQPFVIAIGSDHQFQLLSDILGFALPEHWMKNSNRVRNRNNINALLQKVFTEKSREEWIQLLQSKKLPIAPVLTVSEALTDPKVAEFIRKSGDFIHWRGPMQKEIALAEPPRLGEHSAQIRQEFSS